VKKSASAHMRVTGSTRPYLDEASPARERLGDGGDGQEVRRAAAPSQPTTQRDPESRKALRARAAHARGVGLQDGSDRRFEVRHAKSIGHAGETVKGASDGAQVGHRDSYDESLCSHTLV
jgi:hypothetical protein